MTTDISSDGHIAVKLSAGEVGKSVVDALDGNILYINVMNRLSVDRDCDGSPAGPDMHDMCPGIFCGICRAYFLFFFIVCGML